MIKFQRRSFSIISILETGLLQAHTMNTWLVVIPLSAMATKCIVVLPLEILRWRSNQRFTSIKPLLNAYYNTFEFKMKKSNPDKRMDMRDELRQEIRRLWSKNRCHPWRTFASVLIQIPLVLSMTFAIRSLSGFPIPFMDNSNLSIADGMRQEGISWFQDLSMSDPTLIGPIVLGSLHLMNYHVSFYRIFI